MPLGEIVKAAEAGGESCFEAIGLEVGDTSAGLEATELEAVGVGVAIGL